MSDDIPAHSPQKSLTRWFGELIGRSEEEKLLIQRQKKRKWHRAHLVTYLGLISVMWTLCLFAGPHVEIIPGLLSTLFFGIFITIHTLNFREWMRDNREAFLAAEESLRRQGKRLPAGSMTPVAPRKVLPAGKDPLLARCEEAAEQTRERLNGVGAGEVEALAVVDEGLNRVRELLENRRDLDRVLMEAGGSSLDEERSRIEQRLASTQDLEARSLYESQLELLKSRTEKVRSLRGLQERIVAYAESYLAALANLRMDAARLKTMDLPHSTEFNEMMKPVRQIEQQVEGMRTAMQEVARTVRMMGQ